MEAGHALAAGGIDGMEKAALGLTRGLDFGRVLSGGLQAGEAKVAVHVGDRGGFAGIERAVAVAVEVDGDALQAGVAGVLRSEERRVGKERRSRWWPYH